MDLQDCSVAESLQIFPVAWKYNVKKLIEKCLNSLKPVDLNENICLTLNLAVRLQCKCLKDTIIHFLLDKSLVYKLFSEENFYFKLEPESLRMVLEYTKMDSYILTNIFKWAENYLKLHNKRIDSRYFFKEHKIDKFLKLSHFETKNLFFEFDKSDLGKNYFTPNELKVHLEIHDFDPRKGVWMDVKSKTVLVEKFTVKNLFFMENYLIDFSYYFNPVVFYEFPEEPEEKMILFDFSCKIIETEDEVMDGFSSLRMTDAKAENSFHVLKMKPDHNVLSDVDITATITFEFDCRILKMSPENCSFLKFEPNEDNLYFTDFVECLIKRMDSD